MTTLSPRRILAVDPGLQYLGVAVLAGEDLIWCGVKTFPDGDMRPQIGNISPASCRSIGRTCSW
jgi:RNase H-fold protein (predicted Holliday junction resolvase)